MSAIERCISFTENEAPDESFEGVVEDAQKELARLRVIEAAAKQILDSFDYMWVISNMKTTGLYPTTFTGRDVQQLAAALKVKS